MAAPGMLNLVRHFSTTGVARAALVKPPLAVFGIDGNYATALYSAASKQKKLEAVEKEMKTFNDLLKSDSRLGDFLNDPSMKKTVKREALSSIAKKLKLSETFSNFMGALTDNGRLNHFTSIYNVFSQVMSSHRGEVICEVTTAKALDASQLKELQASLNAFLNKGETIKLTTKTDPSIIGGMIVSIGDKYVDMSMSSRINTYSNLIKQAV